MIFFHKEKREEKYKLLLDEQKDGIDWDCKRVKNKLQIKKEDRVDEERHVSQLEAQEGPNFWVNRA